MLVIETVLTVTNTLHWILDSGASSHICNSLQDLVSKQKLKKGDVSLRMGNGAIAAATAKGNLPLVLPFGHILVLKNCLYIPVVPRNVILISSLCKEGMYCSFNKDKCAIYNEKSILLCTGFMQNGLYILNIDLKCN